MNLVSTKLEQGWHLAKRKSPSQATVKLGRFKKCHEKFASGAWHAHREGQHVTPKRRTYNRRVLHFGLTSHIGHDIDLSGVFSVFTLLSISRRRVSLHQLPFAETCFEVLFVTHGVAVVSQGYSSMPVRSSH